MKLLIFVLLSLVHVSVAAQHVIQAQYHGYNSPYSFDANFDYGRTSRWMASIPDTKNVASLSIPGSHDTMTFAVTDPTYQCQNLHLSIQLHTGLRYFDIRARLHNDELLIYHGDKYTQYSYPDVLNTMFHFLDAHPSETILMRLKEESTPINSTIDFLTAFNYYRLNSTLTSGGCSEHFWIPSPAGPTRVPTLGELRGKILILQNFGSDPADYGIKWESQLLSIEDLWDIPDLDMGLEEKFEAITEALEAAGNATEEESGILYLSHLSASVGVLPIEAAAGTQNGSIIGLNDRVGKWLSDGNGGSAGVIIIDFPGQLLIHEVLKRNQ
jgi:1-phosphatidylinositol phosphodiesterase